MEIGLRPIFFIPRKRKENEMDVINTVKEYIEPELIILIPVLFAIGYAIRKNEKIDSRNIPLVLGLIGVVLAALWVVANMSAFSMQGVLIAIFTAIVQGILVAAVAVYVNELIKQQKSKNNLSNLETEETVIITDEDKQE